MADQSKMRLETLELNKETLQELTEAESEAVAGGMARADDPKPVPSGCAYKGCVSYSHNFCPETE
jgi:hypothetical protein